LSEQEQAERLKEMMDNAKWRKTDREKSHKEHKKRKMEEEKIDEYDKTFIT